MRQGSREYEADSHVLHGKLPGALHVREARDHTTTPSKALWLHEHTGRCLEGAWQGPGRAIHTQPAGSSTWTGLGKPVSGCLLLLLAASFISPEKSRKMLPTPAGTHSGTSLLGPSLLDGNSRDSFVSRSLADVAEVGARP